MSAAPRLDAANIAGMTSLMNQQNIKQGIDLEKIEKEIMGKRDERGYSSKYVENDPVKLYTQELNQLADDLGIELLDDEIKLNKSGPIGGDRLSTMIKPIKTHFNSKIRSPRSLSSSNTSKSSRSGSSRSGSSRSRSSGSESGSYTSGSYTSGSEYSDSEGSSEYSNSDRSGSSKSSRSRRHSKKKYNNYMPTISEEKQQINNVISNLRHETHTAIGEEKEKIIDNKASKLEQIGQLKLSLEEEGIDCSSVSNPNMDSPITEIDGVLNILRLKNDRNRYSTIAEEIILGIAEGIETVFDGSRRIPILGWRPDYTGYHNTVNVKLHRMRFETSQVVGSIIEARKINAPSRIALELLPSFLLYPRQQKLQKSTQSLYDGYSSNKITDARGAYNAIRVSDEKKSLYDALDI